MRTLPTTMLHLLNPFVPLFSRRLWPHVQVLLAGFSAAPGKRTVSAALRIMGLGQTEQFQRYHRLLNRAIWSGREASRVLLGLLVKTFLADGPLVIGVDGTLERRWWPEGEIVAVADCAYASLRLLASCQRFLPRPVTFITRLRLDAALYTILLHPAGPGS